MVDFNRSYWFSGIEINDTYRITQTNKTDWFGRKTSDSVSLYNITNEVVNDDGNVVTPATTLSRIETEYSYPVASDGKTTTRLEKFINKTYNGTSTSATVFDGSSYEYDKQNRIIAEKTLTSSGSKTDKYSYQYDKLGQLVRFNDAVANKSYTYSYDSNGNMLSKKTYNYTTGQLGTSTGTISYAYDSQWKDKLASYNGQSITYNSIGNPINYMGATLTWEGRNLKSYEKGSKKLQFEYDENGMRYRTTVTNSGSVSYYDYVWDSNKLVSMVYTSGNTSQTAKYLYGSSDEVIGMVITDSNNSISTYYYLRNAQGDITGIVNSSGKKIISYTYDVFGNCSETYHSTNTTEYAKYLQANVLNPFRYRGYCFDSEIGLYYLQSRYYDPNTGRFINSDDTNYLGVTGTVLSYNLFAYCENDPVNKVDYNGYSPTTDLFKLFKQAVNVLEDILRYIKNTFTVELKAIRKQVKLLSKKQVKKVALLNDSIKEINKINKKLGRIGKIISMLIFITSCGEYIKAGKSYTYVIVRFILEGFIDATSFALSELCKLLGKVVPGVGFILGIFASYAVPTLISLYFTDSRLDKNSQKLAKTLNNKKSVSTSVLLSSLVKTAFS